MAAVSMPALEPVLGDALRLYRRGRFDDAAAKYGAILKQYPNFAEAYAGVARCYLKQEKIQEAYESAAKAVKTAPDSQAAHVALGEVYFRQGKMHDAEDEFLKVVNSVAPEARAYLGLARVSSAISMHARARQMLEKAYALDPGDPEILWRWLNTLEPAERVKALTAYLAAASIDDAGLLSGYKAYLESLKRQEKLPPRECKLVAGPASMETYLWPMSVRPPYLSGYGLDVKVNGRGSRLLLDTGISGILLSPRAAERAGILPRAQTKIVGIGDKDDMDLYIGYADSIKVGPLEFRNCPVAVAAKEKTGHDGLVGTDLFAHYLITLDFPGRLFKLSELPPRPNDPPAAGQAVSGVASSMRAEAGNHDPVQDAQDQDAQSQDGQDKDRYVAPGMEDYTTVFRFDHMLLVPTTLNGFPPKLFLMDTGSDHNYISLQAAREVTKVHEDFDTHVRGLNGRVKKIFRADKVTLSFGRYKHEDQDVVVFDHSSLSREAGTEISGTLGFALLQMLKIKIDYRDGLVDFDYNSTRVH